MGAAWLGTMIAALGSLILVAWITVLNLLYLLAQLITVAADTSVARAWPLVPRFVARERRLVGGIFLVVIALVILATAASVLATAALGFIGFVPVVGLAMLPLAAGGLALPRAALRVSWPGGAWRVRQGAARIGGRAPHGWRPRHFLAPRARDGTMT